MAAERSLINLGEECLGHHLSDKQKAYVATLTEYSAQHYVLAMEEDGAAECKLLYLRSCEQVSPGQCVAVAGERLGKRP